MTWQLGAIAIMAAALAGGFAWYERSHPDARTVALVATMAALAALGRIAFAALPNVKPSTDIVFVTGFALGAAPGFAVGALTGLVSNFFFGQGPWTVWQMAGWALTGVLGAGLARVTGGRVARWWLAIVCMIVGYAFTVGQDVGDWVTYSDHSLPALGAYVAQGTGFDFVHAIGCLVFALAFGPALVRSLDRFRRRLRVTWVAPGPTVAVALALFGASAALAPPAARAGASPTGYLLGAQNSDGGFGAAPGAASSPLFSGWAALGLAAQGINPGDVRRGGATLLQYVSAGAASASDVGSLERSTLVARAAGANPYALGGRNLVAGVRRAIAGSGAVSDQVNLTTFAILALRAAGAPVPGRTMGWLAAQQNSDGGFGFGTAGTASDVDDTGAVLEALAGSRPGTIAAAVRFLRAAQNGDGGLPAQPGSESDAQSTAWAIQGLVAAGVDPDTLHRGGAPSPMGYLRSLIAPDGHVRYSRWADTTPVWVTAQALMALARRPLPLAPVPAAATASTGASNTTGGSATTNGAAGDTTSTAQGATTGAMPPAATVAGATPTTRSRATAPVGRRRRGTADVGMPWLAQMTMADERAILAAVGRVLSPVGVRTAQPPAPVSVARRPRQRTNR